MQYIASKSGTGLVLDSAVVGVLMMASRQYRVQTPITELPIRRRGCAREFRLLYLGHFGEDLTAHLEAGTEVRDIAALR